MLAGVAWLRGMRRIGRAPTEHSRAGGTLFDERGKFGAPPPANQGCHEFLCVHYRVDHRERQSLYVLLVFHLVRPAAPLALNVCIADTQRVNPMSFRTNAVVSQLWRRLAGENALETRGLHARDLLGLVIDDAHQALGNRVADSIQTHQPHDAVLRAGFHTIPVASL